MLTKMMIVICVGRRTIFYHVVSQHIKNDWSCDLLFFLLAILPIKLKKNESEHLSCIGGDEGNDNEELIIPKVVDVVAVDVVVVVAVALKAKTSFLPSVPTSV